MESTIPRDNDSDYQLEVDILRRRWTTIGISFTEDELERAVRANAKSRLKKRAEAEFSDEEDDEDEPQPEARSSTGRSAKSRTDKSDAADWDFDVSEINDAWQQYDEEQQQQQPPGEDEPGAAADLDEPEPDPEPGPGPQPTPTAAQAVQEAVRTAAKQRGPRKPGPGRKMPHRNCRGVWIPREVWEDGRFQTTDERILYLEVNHLDQEDGCIAKNQHFADYLGCSVQSVQDMIHSMTMRAIFICSYPSRTTRILHIAGGRRSYPRHRG